ncbi:DUF6113 family protein [Streptomyces polyrhachis]|uniref:DUF6113 family protein n=1 Tax=Streptomyces polyrhachis TaxID=1282885 RepID=A0ABW2GJ62_9ACTN
MTAPRLLALAGLALLGLLTGAAGVLVQAAWFPWGLLLSVLGIGGLCFGGVLAVRTRGGGFAPAAGWLVAVLLLMTTRPEGDYLVGAAGSSYLFLLGGIAAAVICTTAPPVETPSLKAGRLVR